MEDAGVIVGIDAGAVSSAFQQQVVTGFSRSFKTYLNGIAQAAEIPIE